MTDVLPILNSDAEQPPKVYSCAGAFVKLAGEHVWRAWSTKMATLQLHVMSPQSD
jgi:hypothetical protein